MVDEAGAACAFEPALAPADEGHRLALALTDALMTRPGAMPDELVTGLRARFSAEQLVELTLKVMKFNIQKAMVALGTDVEATPEMAARFPWAAEAGFVTA